MAPERARIDTTSARSRPDAMPEGHESIRVMLVLQSDEWRRPGDLESLQNLFEERVVLVPILRDGGER
jgi:hypothetical protein